MEEILKILDLKLRVAYGTGYSDCENIGMGMDEDEYMSEISFSDIQEAIKLYASNCVKASFEKITENVVGENCFINVSEFSDDNNIIIL
ncbi:hypothetical protein [Chryseobacterium sp. WX]|uniref:hypothetical protein n=1 Tax=Chryseobacterium sp. WX TaxID=3031803 RepID=UPI00240A8D46|nr:hypothetical protein [Chryseobacterium sp. WX]WFB67071.1 hypothetical protein PZ898_20505 [Chryseobacterium sp. WX]